MLQINLTAEEAMTLKDVLTNYVSDLRMEIAGTDAMELRERLKEEEVFLKKLLQQLG